MKQLAEYLLEATLVNSIKWDDYDVQLTDINEEPIQFDPKKLESIIRNTSHEDPKVIKQIFNKFKGVTGVVITDPTEDNEEICIWYLDEETGKPIMQR